MVNTYACKQATPTSKNIRAKTTANGILAASFNTPLNDNILQAKPLRILTRVCPAIMFAKSRTPKLIARNIYETSSITTKKGERIKGAPGGRRKLKNVSHEFEIR